MDNEKEQQSMSDFLGDTFSRALRNALSTMTGFTVEKTVVPEEQLNHTIAGAMMLIGSKSMFLVVSTNDVTAQTLISYMTGIDPSDLSQGDLQDGITEFANMVAGSTREALVNTEYEYSLTVPFTIVGEHIRFLTKSRIEKYNQLYHNDEVQILLQIFSF